MNTEPCVLCCESLEKVRDAAIQNLSGKNLEVFLTEIGVAFHRQAILDLNPYQSAWCGPSDTDRIDTSSSQSHILF